MEFSFAQGHGTLNSVLVACRNISAWLWNYRHFVLAVLALALYLVGLGRPPLWEPDEGRYAEIAREMVTSHDYITPRNNFVRYFEKPPLVYWVTAASLELLGRNEFAVRLQAAIASAGQVAITAALGEEMFGATTGVIAGMALALSPLFFAFARFATPDPALAFFITASLACSYMGIRASVVSVDRRPKWMMGAAAMLAMGTLTKGPVALVLGGTIAVLWLLQSGWHHQAFRIPWLGCAVLYLAVTLPWFLAVARRNPGFVGFFVIHEHFRRYLESTEHAWGPWFYIPITIAGTWPWFYFAPYAFLPASNRKTQRWPASQQKHGEQPASNVDTHDQYADTRHAQARASSHSLLIWFVVIFVFYSIPRSKLGEYILPALPPIAILAAHGIARIKEFDLQQQRVFLIFAAINLAAASAILVASTVVSAGVFRDVVGEAHIVALALIAMAVASALCFHSASAIVLSLAIGVVVEAGAAMSARERIAPLVSYRTLAAEISPYLNRGCRLMSYGHFEQALPFYTGKREILVNYRGELQPFGPPVDASGSVFVSVAQLKKTWESDECTVLIVNSSDLPIVADSLSPEPILIGREGKKVAAYNRQMGMSGRNRREPPGLKVP